MTTDNLPVGELLVKLCELSREHNVDISFRQHSFYPNEFEIRLDRKNHHAVALLDTTRTFKDEPERSAEYVFQRSLYDIKKLEEKERDLDEREVQGWR